MKYYVDIAGDGGWIERTESGVSIDGDTRSAQLTRIDGDEFQLTVDGRNYRVYAVRTDDGWRITLKGRTLHVLAEDERARAIREMAGEAAGATGPRELRAPMPGLVVRVLVEPGQRVEPGDGLVVVEAMKMENELRADSAATVEAISAQSGDAVDRDDLLITFEADPA